MWKERGILSVQLQKNPEKLDDIKMKSIQIQKSKWGKYNVNMIGSIFAI